LFILTAVNRRGCLNKDISGFIDKKISIFVQVGNILFLIDFLGKNT